MKDRYFFSCTVVIDPGISYKYLIEPFSVVDTMYGHMSQLHLANWNGVV